VKDADLIAYATEFREDILDGGESWMRCFMVCAPLAPLLRMSGVAVELVESDLGDTNHVWLRLPDGRALDPTADQFEGLDLPPVYLGPPLRIHAANEKAPPTL
jgi:hypothetical protein